MKGLLDVGDPRQWWTETIKALAAPPLFYPPEHVSALSDLPLFHRDFFDRALIARAAVEDLTLVTTDKVIARYASERFRVLG